MKKQIYLVLGLLFLVLIQGCEKSSEQFSCDEQVHDWTVKNLAVLENMNRAELATLPFAYQRAALRVFAPEKKCEIWNEKLDIVLAQQWDDAIHAFEEVQTTEPNFYAAQVYIERCLDLKKNPPPPEWDGVYVMTTK